MARKDAKTLRKKSTQRRGDAKGKELKVVGKVLSGLAAWRENNNCTQRRGEEKRFICKELSGLAAWRGNLKKARKDAETQREKN